MAKSNKKTFFLSFGLTLSLGLFFVLFSVRASTIDVSATVSALCGNGILETGEACDGTDGAGNCYNNTCKANCTCPACGNGTIETGETCESDTDCATGYICNANCNCQITGGGPIIPPPPPPPLSVCGNNIIESGEECDDGNTVSGDGCSAVCQLEIGCGNGVLDAGEECDDNNLVSGDCCSAACQKEIIFSNVSESVTEFTATIDWQTWCEESQSVLEWGKTPAVDEGSISGLWGKKYSQKISDLSPGTVYYYRVTANVGSLQNILTGSFLTLGLVEICNNGIDDDLDGFIDISDINCPCQAEWQCLPANWDEVPCINGQKTRQCQKINNCWNIEPWPEAVLGCPPCENITCPPNNQLNSATCSCEPIPVICGNGVCEPPAENPYNCQADCPVACLSDWQCGAWEPEPCPESGIHVRQCFDNNACLMPVNQPATQQSCGGVCPGLSCSGICQKINIQNCICEEYVPCCGNGICENSETYEQCPADCIKTCLPDWTCDAWSECQNGIQVRYCLDLNKCNLDLDRPPEERSCVGACEAACSTCQQLDKGNCRCLPQAPCCGNRICEPAETNWSCPIDCAVPPDLHLALPQCLDGLDNDKDGLIDYPADPACVSPSDNSEMSFAEMVQSAGKFIREKIWNNPPVQAANKKVAAPVLIGTVAISTVSSFSIFNFLSYLRFLFTQPVTIISRRKRYKWGIIYNSLTKQPIDLAIVRFYEKDTNRLVQSRVTDRLGRYLWLAEPGQYYVTVTKPKFNFPTIYLKDKKEDVKFLDIYHGETIAVKESGASVALNIPLDPREDTRPVRKIIIQHYLRRIQFIVAFSAIPLAVASFAVSPGLFTFVLLIFHCLLYSLFRRLGYQKPPKNWGIIYDQTSKQPLLLAITRIYDKQYHKLLETRLTDSHGRYSFLVSNNLYYLTAEKAGYNPYKSGDIDLIQKDREAIVNLDIGLAKALAAGTYALPPVSSEPTSLPSQEKPSVSAESISPVLPEPSAFAKATADKTALPSQEKTGVSRQELEELLKSKQEKLGKPAILVSEDKPEVRTAEIKKEPVAKNKVEENKNLPAKEKSIFG